MKIILFPTDEYYRSDTVTFWRHAQNSCLVTDPYAIPILDTAFKITFGIDGRRTIAVENALKNSFSHRYDWSS